MQKLSILLCVVSAVGLAGCNKDSGGRAPAVGYVTIDGAPLSDVYVTFRPDDGEPGNGGFAITDSEGRFEIAYPDTGSGLVPARYRVTVAEPPRDSNDSQTAPGAPATANAAGTPKFPPLYSSPENTPLRVVVSADGAALKVELSSNPTQR